MTPTAAELLAGCAAALMAGAEPEDAGVFAAARARTVTMINLLVAQEVASGAEVRIWENAALSALLAAAAPKYGAVFAEAGNIISETYSIEGLDHANARLRRLLIRLHEAVEAAADYQLDRQVLAHYREMARRRELSLPPMKAAT
jgi:hypothetical protein